MKINWSEALADYLKDETQSYASIARKYGVSKQSVVKRAVMEGWQSLRRKTLLEVDQKLTEIVGEDIAVVNARHAQIGKVLQAAALKAIKERNLRSSIEASGISERFALDNIADSPFTAQWYLFDIFHAEEAGIQDEELYKHVIPINIEWGRLLDGVVVCPSLT